MNNTNTRERQNISQNLLVRYNKSRICYLNSRKVDRQRISSGTAFQIVGPMHLMLKYLVLVRAHPLRRLFCDLHVVLK